MDSADRTGRNTQGVALLLTLGILALLATIALTFIYMTRLDKTTTRNYMQSIEAQLAAESGFEYAVARLLQLSGATLQPHEMRDLEHAESKASFARSTLIGGRPALASGVLAESPVLGTVLYHLKIDDESGKLNLNDTNAALNIFVPFEDDYGKGRLYKIVETLAGILFKDDLLATSVAHYLFLDKQVGRVSYKQQQFPDMFSVRKALKKAGLTADQQDVFLRFVTLHAWQDPHVLKPSTPALPGRQPATFLETQARQFELEPRSPVNINTAQPQLLEALIAPLQGAFLAEGPPENDSSNHYGFWATGHVADAPKTGDAFQETPPLGTVRLTANLRHCAHEIALLIHRRVHVDNNPFETWEEFRHFLDNEAPETLWLPPDFQIPPMRSRDEQSDFYKTHHPPAAGLDPETGPWELAARPTAWDTHGERQWWKHYFTQAQRDLLFANFNPNSLLNDFNPNRTIHLMVDKSQLTVYTTEFSFQPTGIFSIESRGEVYNPAGGLEAACNTQAVVKLFELLRHTSQAHWMQDTADINSVGDRFYEIGESLAHRAGKSRYSLQSYPEPLIPGREGYVQTAYYDGYLMPATLETKPAADGCLWASFSSAALDPLALDEGVEGFKACHTDTENRPSFRSLFHTAENQPPGNVFADGAFSELGRTLTYSMKNFSATLGRAGAVAFWIKPNFNPGVSSRIRKFIAGPARQGVFAHQAMPALFYLCNPASDEPDGIDAAREFARFDPLGVYGVTHSSYWLPTRCLAFGWAWADPGNRNSFQQGAAVSPSVNFDYPCYKENVRTHDDRQFAHFLGRQWNHIVCGWDVSGVEKRQALAVNGKVLANNRGAAGAFYGNTGRSGETYLEYWQRKGNTSDAPGTGVFQTDFSNLGWLRFGELPPASAPFAGACYADSTFDEIEGYPLYSMDPGEERSIPNLAKRFNQGRYWKSPAHTTGDFQPVACYTSPLISMKNICREEDRGVTLSAVSWTLYWPYNNRAVDSDAPAGNVRGTTVNPDDPPDPCYALWDTRTAAQAWDPVSVDVRTATGAWCFDTTLEKSFTYAGGGKWIGGTPPAYLAHDRFQYRVYFHLAVDCPALYEAPVLDDITFIFKKRRPLILLYTSNLN